MNLLKECENMQNIGISGHIRPDGDCVCSCLALYQYLTKCFPDISIKVYLENPPETFRDIKGYDLIDTEFCDDTVYDLFFCLDCEPERLGKAGRYFKEAHRTVNIDHHVSNPGGGSVNYIYPTVGSSAELIYDLIGEENMDCDIAKALYVGIIHDTGVFQYSCTSPETMRKGSYLISFGFDFPGIIEETFYQKTYKQAQILGRALIESIRFMDGHCIVSCMTRKMMEFYGAGSDDFEGIVNQLRNIKGVDCAIFMYETDVLEYRISMRSTDKVDVAAVASYFGGGGHARAAGCSMKGTFHDCVNNLSLHIAKQLEAESK